MSARFKSWRLAGRSVRWLSPASGAPRTQRHGQGFAWDSAGSRAQSRPQAPRCRQQRAAASDRPPDTWLQRPTSCCYCCCCPAARASAEVSRPRTSRAPAPLVPLSSPTFSPPFLASGCGAPQVLALDNGRRQPTPNGPAGAHSGPKSPGPASALQAGDSPRLMETCRAPSDSGCPAPVTHGEQEIKQ